LKYRYYAVTADSPTNIADLVSDATKLPSAYGAIELVAGTKEANTFLPSFYPQINTYGKYKILVEAEYVLKDRNYDGADVSDLDRKRSYVIYRGFAGGTDFDSATVVNVTPKPGKAYITIEAVRD